MGLRESIMGTPSGTRTIEGTIDRIGTVSGHIGIVNTAFTLMGREEVYLARSEIKDVAVPLSRSGDRITIAVEYDYWVVSFKNETSGMSFASE